MERKTQQESREIQSSQPERQQVNQRTHTGVLADTARIAYALRSGVPITALQPAEIRMLASQIGNDGMLRLTGMDRELTVQPFHAAPANALLAENRIECSEPVLCSYPGRSMEECTAAPFPAEGLRAASEPSAMLTGGVDGSLSY